jgi:hypothetical protein
MGFFRILVDAYLQPRRAMEAVAQLETPRYGALYVLLRGAMLGLFFYLPFYLLKFEPITPAYLDIVDTPDYFLYAALLWPLFGLLSWIYLAGASYVLLRLPGYRVNFDQILNLSGLLELVIGIVIMLFDWLMVAIRFHNDPVFMGIAHMVIADPWSMIVSAIFYKKHFDVPPWVTVLLGVVLRLLYMPIAMLFVRT